MPHSGRIPLRVVLRTNKLLECRACEKSRSAINWEAGTTAIGISPLAEAVVIAAAITHATWNAIAKGVKDKILVFLWLNAAIAVMGAMGILVFGLPLAKSIPFVVTSALIQVIYNFTLLSSYRYGDLNRVYPLARGMAPLLVSVGAFIFAGERLSAGEIVGVVVIAAGLVSLVELRTLSGRDERKALLLATATGLTIASYSLVDGIGVRRSGSPWAYAALLFCAQGIVIAVTLAVLQKRKGSLLIAAGWKLGIAAGALSYLAYAAILWAQDHTPLAVVSALRETSVVAAAVIGTIYLKEPMGRSRLVASLVVAGGAVILVTNGLGHI